MVVLLIRVFLYTVAGAIGWTGAITMTGPDNACVHIPSLAEAVTGGAGVVYGGGILAGTFIFSRIAKRLGWKT